MIGVTGSCRRHRPVLVDLVDRGERGPATAAALDHLALCADCERELTEMALTIAALRRAGNAYRALRVPDAGAEGVRVASALRPPAPTRRRPDWSRRLQLGGLLAGAGIAAMVVAPQIGLMPVRQITDPAPASRPAAAAMWQQAERRLAATPDPGTRAVLVLPPRYPEGLLRPWKEVPATDATTRELEPS